MSRWHECPGPECQVRLPSHVLACKTHWYRLPADLRFRIWRAWNAGDMTGHLVARRQAAEFLAREVVDQP